MINLLENNFRDYYKVSVGEIENWFLETNEAYFELDDLDSNIIFHKNKSNGTAKFSNPNKIDFQIIEYEKFINNIVEKDFLYERKRCDIILNSKDKNYFVLGDLTDRKPKRKILSKKKQLLSTLKTLIEVPEIFKYINAKKIKKCCIFNKQSKAPELLTVTTAFNRLSNKFKEGLSSEFKEIEEYGFEFYQLEGEQTLIFDE